MNNLKNITADECLQGLLEKNAFVSSDFSEGSLLACLNTLCKQRFIPILYYVIYDETWICFMHADEIARYKNPELRKEQRAEMEAFVNRSTN
jgi:hypothetical protein